MSDDKKEYKTLGTELPAEITRVRDQIMPNYIKIGKSGEPALFMMRAAMDGAIKALAEGDMIAMLKFYEDLKGFTE